MLSSVDQRKLHTVRSYDSIARWYDILAATYSCGLIARSKHAQLKFLSPGDAVLCAGCGSGSDVVAAAQLGCRVTAVDKSRKMLRLLAGRLDAEGLSAKLICRPVEQMRFLKRFDIVLANYFLNCFPIDTTRCMLSILRSSIGRDGRLLIADVAPASGTRIHRWLNSVYLQSALVPFWLAGLAKWHRNYDYLPLLEAEGFQIEEVQCFSLLNFGPIVFRNIVSRPPAT